jgi:hydroxymethylpyrimidine pyrophosphatase-like HAD family hydrolase
VIVICDLDGTLALRGDRGPFDYSRVGEDAPNPAVVLTAKLWLHAGYTLVFVSARDDSCYDETKAWLEKNKLYSNQNGNLFLYMRRTGDYRADDIVKRELYDEHISPQEVLLVLDDRTKVVNMWRSLGLTCFQVAPGDF